MQADDIGRLEQGVPRHRLDVESGGLLRGDIGVVADEMAAPAVQAGDDFAGDAAQPDKTDRLFRQLKVGQFGAPPVIPVEMCIRDRNKGDKK